MPKRKAANSPQRAASRWPAEPIGQRKAASGSMGCTSELVPGFAAFAFACLVLRGNMKAALPAKINISSSDVPLDVNRPPDMSQFVADNAQCAQIRRHLKTAWLSNRCLQPWSSVASAQGDAHLQRAWRQEKARWARGRPADVHIQASDDSTTSPCCPCEDDIPSSPCAFDGAYQ